MYNVVHNWFFNKISKFEVKVHHCLIIFKKHANRTPHTSCQIEIIDGYHRLIINKS